MAQLGIPPNLQIDAVLAGRLWNLVQRFCGGAWGTLPLLWTVSADEIFAEAKRRGLDAFVLARPPGEGFCLSESNSGYVVFYAERGTRSEEKRFEELEPAFLHWLAEELRANGLSAQSES